MLIEALLANPGPKGAKRVYSTYYRSTSEPPFPSELARSFKTLTDNERSRVERVLEALRSRTKKIMEEWPAFDDRTPAEINSLIPEVARTTQGFMNSLQRFKGQGESYEQALENVWTRVVESIVTPQHERLLVPFLEATNTAWHSSIGRKEGQTHSWDKARAVGFELARGTHLKFLGDNPYLYLLTLHELGPTRFGFRKVLKRGAGEEENLVIDFPMYLKEVDDPGDLQACLVFDDRNEGDKAVNAYHHYEQDCKEALALPSRVVLPKTT